MKIDFSGPKKMQIPKFRGYEHPPDQPITDLIHLFEKYLTRDVISILVQYCKPQYLAFAHGKRWLVGTPNIYIVISPERISIATSVGCVHMTDARLTMTKDHIVGIDTYFYNEKFLDHIWHTSCADNEIILGSAKYEFVFDFSKFSIMYVRGPRGYDVSTYRQKLKTKSVDGAVAVMNKAFGKSEI